MIYLLYGFVLGFVVPYIARRMDRIMPATLGYAIVQIFKPAKRYKKNNLKRMRLLRRYFYRSVLIGIVTSVIFYLFYLKFGVEGIFYKLLFVWLSILLAEIDTRMMLLPDIITFPLALIGFYVAITQVGFVGEVDAALGGLFGYFLPVFASLFIVWKHKDAFGGGDIKYLAVIGIWCGVSALLYTIILASISFGMYSIKKRQKSGAFGPWLVYSILLILMLYS